MPTGIVVMMQDSRSQHKNRAAAMNILRVAHLRRRARSASTPTRAGRPPRERSAPATATTAIRTYNFPQGRVTDHRINLTLYKLPQVMAGEGLSELIDALTTEHQAAQLAAQGSGGVVNVGKIPLPDKPSNPRGASARGAIL